MIYFGAEIFSKNFFFEMFKFFFSFFKIDLKAKSSFAQEGFHVDGLISISDLSLTIHLERHPHFESHWKLFG